MMGILPETSRLRTSVTLLILLLIAICFLGFTYWTQLNHNQSYQKKISFLERTISKMADEGDEADGREADLRREMTRQKEGLQHMNAMAHQHIIRLKQGCDQERDQYTKAIAEKEDLISSLKQAYLKLQQDMEDFQKNQSQLLEKFTLQSEKMEMHIRLKEKCYSQMNSISKRISLPSLSSDLTAAGRSSKTQDKGSKEEQADVKKEVGNSKADLPPPFPDKPSTSPSSVRMPILPGNLVDQLKRLFSDTGSKEDQSEVKATVNVTSLPASKPPATPSLYRALIQRPQPADKLKNVSSDLVKGSDTNSETPKNIASAATVVNGDDEPKVLKPNKKEETKEEGKLMNDEVKEAVELKQPTQPLKNEPDLLKSNKKEETKEEEKAMNEKVKEAVERKQPTQPLNDEPNILKPNDKEEAMEEEKSMDENVKEAVEEKKLDKLRAGEPGILKSNEGQEAKKAEELEDEKAIAAVEEKQPVQPLEDALDLLQTNEKEEANNEEEPF